MNRHERRAREAIGRRQGGLTEGARVVQERLAAIDRLECAMNFGGEDIWEILGLRRADYRPEVALEIDAVDRMMGPEGRAEFVRMARSGILPV